MQNGDKPADQCEQLLAYMADARKAQETFEAAKRALDIEYCERQREFEGRRDAANKLATAYFESAQRKIDDLYNDATQPHSDVLHRAFDLARVERDQALVAALAVATTACSMPENSSHDAIPFGPERDRFEKEREAIRAVFDAADNRAEETFQLAFKPIKALWKFTSEQNKAALKAAERRAYAVWKGEERQLWLSYEAKKDALLQDFRARREQRMAIWQQYLAGNEPALEQLPGN